MYVNRAFKSTSLSQCFSGIIISSALEHLLLSVKDPVVKWKEGRNAQRSPRPGCVTLDESLTLSGPQFPYV